MDALHAHYTFACFARRPRERYYAWGYVVGIIFSPRIPPEKSFTSAELHIVSPAATDGHGFDLFRRFEAKCPPLVSHTHTHTSQGFQLSLSLVDCRTGGDIHGFDPWDPGRPGSAPGGVGAGFHGFSGPGGELPQRRPQTVSQSCVGDASKHEI